MPYNIIYIYTYIYINYIYCTLVLNCTFPASDNSCPHTCSRSSTPRQEASRSTRPSATPTLSNHEALTAPGTTMDKDAYKD